MKSLKRPKLELRQGHAISHLRALEVKFGFGHIVGGNSTLLDVTSPGNWSDSTISIYRSVVRDLLMPLASSKMADM